MTKHMDGPPAVPVPLVTDAAGLVIDRPQQDSWADLPPAQVGQVQRMGLWPPGEPETVRMLIGMDEGLPVVGEAPAALLAGSVRMLTAGIPGDVGGQQQRLAQMLANLDRCVHGRHEGDACAGWRHDRPGAGCPGGYSVGNALFVTGLRVGTTLYGEPIYVPPRSLRADPQAWLAPPQRPDCEPLPDDEASRMTRRPVAQVAEQRVYGHRWYQVETVAQLWAEGHLIGVQRIDATHAPVGPFQYVELAGVPAAPGYDRPKGYGQPGIAAHDVWPDR